MAAKPIIDIDIIYFNQNEFEPIKLGLNNIGYYHAGNQGIQDRDVFKRKGKCTAGTLDIVKHHLYVCPVESNALERHILTRNFLRKHDWARLEFQQLKYQLAHKAGEYRKLYALLKQRYANRFIDSIVEEERRTAN